MLIRQLAKKYKITRTTLLYYDSINLLKPFTRNNAGYRIYSRQDEEKLEKIIYFKKMGFKINKIQNIFSCNILEEINCLLIQLNCINKTIEELKNQQRNILSEFKKKNMGNTVLCEKLKKHEIEKTILAGIDPNRLHDLFAEHSPGIHHEFIEFIDSLPKNLMEKLYELKKIL